MKWLESKLYEKEEIQNSWSESEWADVWAQIIHEINNALIITTQSMIDECTDFKERHQMEYFLRKKEYATEEIKHWDISLMSEKIKAIIKADLMQRRCYNSFLKKFPNLKDLDDVNRLKEKLYINSESSEPFNWYYNMNICV